MNPCFSSSSRGSPLSTNGSCLPGFYCPNTIIANLSTWPVACPPDPGCQVSRIYGNSCPPQGQFEPTICAAGYYCPDQWTITLCPAGFYCPTGSAEPYPCEQFSHCPPGTILQTNFVGLALCTIFDILLCVMYLLTQMPMCLQAKDLKIPPTEDHRAHYVSRLPSLPPPPTSLEATTKSSKETLLSKISTEHGYPSGGRFSKMDLLLETFRAALGRNSIGLTFRFDNLGLKLSNGQAILQGVSGAIRPSCMTAVMGPSGSGKTTFMNVLGGSVARTSGRLFVNHAETTDMRRYHKIIGYVPQEDILLRELTVREIVLYSARIRLPKSWADVDVTAFVDNVLRALNLSSVSNSTIGDDFFRGVSGGERKRVNIALEIAAIPVCLFLDEPTSGLDASAALDVVELLRQLASMGVTIVAVLHQPRIEIFRKFDDVLMLVPGGRTAYSGPSQLAAHYFHSIGFAFEQGCNEADAMMDILAGQGCTREGMNAFSPAALAELWAAKEAASLTRPADPATSRQPAPPISSVPSSANEQFCDQKSRLGPDPVTPLLLSTAESLTHEPPNTPPMLMPEATERISTCVSHSNIVSYEALGLISPADLDRLNDERGASVVRQCCLAHHRSVTQQCRALSTLALETAVGLLAGLLIGLAVNGSGEIFHGVYVADYIVLSPAPETYVVPLMGQMVGFSIALAAAAAGVQVFSEEKTVYWREAARGHSRVAYYVGKSIAALYRIFLSSLHFTSVYIVMAAPLVPFARQWLIVALMFFGVYGLAATISMLVTLRGNAALIAVIASLFAAVFCGFGPTLNQASGWGLAALWDTSFNRWGAEALFSEALMPYRAVFQVEQVAGWYGYTLNRFWVDVHFMLLVGLVWRMLAFLLMIALNRDKQR
jgi:ABC-type multidrug transport system ATPase subunit